MRSAATFWFSKQNRTKTSTPALEEALAMFYYVKIENKDMTGLIGGHSVLSL